jgi:CheY-like chemotaxis protein
MLGWAQLLRVGGLSSEEFAQGLETIERNARVQAQLVEDLLDLSRIISGKLRLEVTRVDLPAVIEAALGSARPGAEAKGIRIVPVIDGHVGPVRGDANRLQQVVWNLLSNAIKFTPRDGQVQIVLSLRDGQAEVSVSDSGEGIAPEFLPHVFDRLRQADATTTRKHGGLGLGLSIVRHLAELHGGTVHAQSPGKGRGATFTVLLPTAARGRHEPRPGGAAAADAGAAADARPEGRDDRGDDAAAAAAAARPGPMPSLAGLRVLVVDDEPDARDLVARILSRCGAEVTLAGSAREAAERLPAERPDVLLSDIGMPDQDGYALIRQVRALPPERGGQTPAVALTAFARGEDRERALAEGFQLHVAKPVEPADLAAAVAAVAASGANDNDGDDARTPGGDAVASPPGQ